MIEPRAKHLENLSQYGKNRRTLNKLQDKIKYKTPAQIMQIMQRNKWPYKTRREFFEKRDLALASLLFLTSGRVNEVLRVRVDQIIPEPADPDFLIIQGFYVSKRKAGKDHPTPDIPLPLVGELSPFTNFLLAYIELLKPGDKLFKIGRGRAWAIIRHITNDPNTKEPGWFCHWFRAQSLSYQVNLIRSTIAVAKQRGIENPATLAKYYRGDWRTYKEELKQ